MFEIAYKMGQLRARLEGENAQLMDEIVELEKQEEAKRNGTVEIPLVTGMKRYEPADKPAEWSITCSKDDSNINQDAVLAANNEETFGVKLC